MTTTFHAIEVEGLNVFWRQAGHPENPKLLLGGFPSSSHQFRQLIPALARRFHVVSPDYPGFGNTDLPDPAEWAYTFDHLTDIVEGLLTKIGFTGPMGIYMQDYGGPIGNRLIARHPDWLAWQVIHGAELTLELADCHGGARALDLASRPGCQRPHPRRDPGTPT